MKKSSFLLIGILIGLLITNINKIEFLSINSNNTLNKNDDSLSIMVYDTSKADYIKQENVPVGPYMLNEEKSRCTGNGDIISYDHLTGKVVYQLVGADDCYIYLDVDTVIPTIANLQVSDKTITATIEDNYELAGYAITNSNQTPTSWTDATGATYNISNTVSEYNTYYLHIKDAFGNVSYQEFDVGHKLIYLGNIDNYDNDESMISSQLSILRYDINSFNGICTNRFDFYGQSVIYLPENAYIFGCSTGYYFASLYFCTEADCSNENYFGMINSYYGSSIQISKDIKYFISYTAYVCFEESTIIYVYDEKKKKKLKRKIKDLKVGDIIYTYDGNEKKYIREKVINIKMSLTNQICNIYLDNEIIKVTPGHKVYILNKGWICAGKIEVGDKIYCKDNGLKEILKTEIVKLKNPEWVYNIEVLKNNALTIGYNKIIAACFSVMTLASLNVLENVSAETAPTPPAPPSPPPDVCSM